MSAEYLRVTGIYLKNFANCFRCPITSITGQEIKAWLDGLNIGPSSRNNHRMAVCTLVNFAKENKFLPKDCDEMDAVRKVKEREGEIEIFSPAELVRLLSEAGPDLVPFLAISAFAGLRHAEILRLDWSEIHLDRAFIEVKSSKAKTASRRLAPVTDNLGAWLSPYCQEKGSVVAGGTVWRDWAELSEKTGIAWKKNGLRHSFCSYRVAAIQDVNRVSLEAGNSPQMIFKHYRELVTPDQAKAWFGIKPQNASSRCFKSHTQTLDSLLTSNPWQACRVAAVLILLMAAVNLEVIQPGLRRCPQPSSYGQLSPRQVPQGKIHPMN